MSFTCDGHTVEADDGMTISAALVRAGVPSGIFCGIGICFGCLVTVNGIQGQRGCLTLAHDGDEVTREV